MTLLVVIARRRERRINPFCPRKKVWIASLALAMTEMRDPVIPGRRDSGESGIRGRLERTNETVMAGLDPRLSGLILVDKAHGVDSSAVLSIAKCSRHTRKIPPCATTIQYFTTF